MDPGPWAVGPLRPTGVTVLDCRRGLRAMGTQKRAELAQAERWRKVHVEQRTQDSKAQAVFDSHVGDAN